MRGLHPLQGRRSDQCCPLAQAQVGACLASAAGAVPCAGPKIMFDRFYQRLGHFFRAGTRHGPCNWARFPPVVFGYGFRGVVFGYVSHPCFQRLGHFFRASTRHGPCNWTRFPAHCFWMRFSPRCFWVRLPPVVFGCGFRPLFWACLLPVVIRHVSANSLCILFPPLVCYAGSGTRSAQKTVI